MVEVISKGAAQSWQLENRHKTMAEHHFNPVFAVEWVRKDLGIVLEEARRNGFVAAHPAALVDQFYAEVEQMGGKRWDTSSLFARRGSTQVDLHERLRRNGGRNIITAICARDCLMLRATFSKPRGSRR